jgi:MazG family protein
MEDQKSSSNSNQFQLLREIITTLRDPIRGCPWDREQTHSSLKPYLIEETYEVLDAIEREDMAELCKELGDVLLQVVLHSQLAEENGAFSVIDVIETLCKKLISRHPHVFQKNNKNPVTSSDQVKVQWEQIKEQERRIESGGSTTSTGKIENTTSTILSGVPKALPALLRAQRVSEKAARIGFEWPTIAGIQEQVLDEVREFVTAEKSNDKKEMIDEFGDILFSLVQLARRLSIDAESALQQATDKFTRRFTEMEKQSKVPLSSLTLDELQSLWEGIKYTEKK